MSIAIHKVLHGGELAVSIIDNGGDDSSVSRTVWTSAAFPFSAIGNKRAVVVMVGIEDGSTARRISSVTLGGNAPDAEITQHAQAGDALDTGVFVFDAPPALGTSADIVVTANGSMDNGYYLRCFTLYNVKDPATLQFSGSLGDSNASHAIASVTCPAGGIIMGHSMFNALSGTMTWTNLTEQFDSIIQTDIVSYAYDTQPSAEAGKTVTSLGPSGNRHATIVVSIR